MKIVLIIITLVLAFIPFIWKEKLPKIMVIGLVCLLVTGAVVQILLVLSESKDAARAKYTGILLAPKVNNIPALQIGNGTILIPEDKNLPVLEFLDEMGNHGNLIIAYKGDQLLVSTIIRKPDGSVIAELLDNEWKVSPPPNTFDRNFANNALEVKDDKGDVILQVRFVDNIVQLQGVFYTAEGNGIEICEHPSPEYGAVFHWIGPMEARRYKITPIFKYPSDLHLGELVSAK